MNTIIFIFGLTIGVIIFFYLISVLDWGKRKVKKIPKVLGTKDSSKKGSSKKGSLSEKSSTQNIYADNLKLPPGKRMCPICRRMLSKYEPLYASKADFGGADKILIHGCEKCYKGNSE